MSTSMIVKEDGSIETLDRKSRPPMTLLKFNIIYMIHNIVIFRLVR